MLSGTRNLSVGSESASGKSIANGISPVHLAPLHASVRKVSKHRTVRPAITVRDDRKWHGQSVLFTCTLLALLRKSMQINGAGEGNRTLISGLGSPHSTTEPHPLSLRFGLSGRSPQGEDRRGRPAKSSNEFIQPSLFLPDPRSAGNWFEGAITGQNPKS